MKPTNSTVLYYHSEWQCEAKPPLPLRNWTKWTNSRRV